MIRLAEEKDIQAVAAIYDQAHQAEAEGRISTGWVRAVYPVRDTAVQALARGDLFVEKDAAGAVVGTAIINQQQVGVYAQGHWACDAPDSQVMVLHTLVIDPRAAGQGYGSRFVAFYEDYARTHGCRWLRMDTNAINRPARTLYHKLGFREAGVIPCTFNGIAGVNLILLEKQL